MKKSQATTHNTSKGRWLSAAPTRSANNHCGCASARWQRQAHRGGRCLHGCLHGHTPPRWLTRTPLIARPLAEFLKP